MLRKLISILLTVVLLLLCTACEEVSSKVSNVWIKFTDSNVSYSVPVYSGDAVYVFSSKPIFKEVPLVESAYEEYSPLDSLGRCTLTSAICCKETMPKQGEQRGSIANVTPTGWKQKKYDIIKGKYLYNRAHLIGWQLTAENDNKRNLITGTRYLNIDGMLPIENLVAAHIKQTEHYVAYQVTPIYDGNGLLPLGVHMEVDCISCDSIGTTYNVFCYNVQPGVSIDYTSGESILS